MNQLLASRQFSKEVETPTNDKMRKRSLIATAFIQQQTNKKLRQTPLAVKYSSINPLSSFGTEFLEIRNKRDQALSLDENAGFKSKNLQNKKFLKKIIDNSKQSMSEA